MSLKTESLPLTSGHHFTALMLNGGHENLLWLERKTGKRAVMPLHKVGKTAVVTGLTYISAVSTFSRYFSKGGILYQTTRTGRRNSETNFLSLCRLSNDFLWWMLFLNDFLCSIRPKVGMLQKCKMYVCFFSCCHCCCFSWDGVSLKEHAGHSKEGKNTCKLLNWRNTSFQSQNKAKKINS